MICKASKHIALCLMILYYPRSLLDFDTTSNMCKAHRIWLGNNKWLKLTRKTNSNVSYDVSTFLGHVYAPPPFEKGGHIALHLSVGMSVGRYVGIP